MLHRKHGMHHIYSTSFIDLPWSSMSSSPQVVSLTYRRDAKTQNTSPNITISCPRNGNGGRIVGGTEPVNSTDVREMKLFPGTTTLGRSSKTRIKSRFVSRKHVELLVEMRACKIRYLGKHTSEVKVNDESVEKEWVEFPLGGRLELMADPKEAFPYTLEPYSKKVLGVVPESSVPAVDVEQYQDFTGRFNCPICTDLFVEPTELDCKHLFCFKCISDVLIQAGCNNKCPSCQSKITPKRKSTILAQRGNKRSRTEGATKYQSQAVGLVKDTIQWLVERRMCDYSDESEWRRRSGLDPLPKLASATTSDPSTGSSGKGGPVGGCPYALGSDETSEVINLLSDSEGD